MTHTPKPTVLAARKGRNYSTTSATATGKSNVARFLLTSNDRTSKRKSRPRSATRKAQ